MSSCIGSITYVYSDSTDLGYDAAGFASFVFASSLQSRVGSIVPLVPEISLRRAGYGYGGMSFQQILATAPGEPCAGGYTCEILGSFDELPVLRSMEAGVALFAGVMIAPEVGAVEAAAAGGRAAVAGGRAAAAAGAEVAGAAANLARTAARGAGTFLFGRGGLLNSNRYLRIGVGRKGGEKVFRIAGHLASRVTGRAHIDLWRMGRL
jgi:hypothetical protein